MSTSDLERSIQKRLEAQSRSAHKSGWDESPGGRYAMTFRKASLVIGISQAALQRLTRRGVAWPVRVGGRWLMPVSEVERLRRKPPAR